MGDLKTFWDNPAYADTSDLGGDGVTSRGTDPNVENDNTTKDAALNTPWDTSKRATTLQEIAETPNSVSRLPPLPTRWQPTEQPPEPPNLTDRAPANVDK